MAKRKELLEEQVKPVAAQILRAQYSMPRQLAATMIQSEAPLTEEGIRFAIALARMHMVPLTGITLISDRYGRPKVFVNTSGILWRLHNDRRGLSRIDSQVLHYPTPEEPFVRARAEVHLGDGSVYANEACTYFRFENGEYYERSRRGEWQPVNVGDRVMAAITKAVRRAGVLAVGPGLPVYEDSYDVEAVEVVQPPSPKTLAELLSMAKELGLSAGDISKLLNKPLTEIAADPASAWIQLQAVKAERAE